MCIFYVFFFLSIEAALILHTELAEGQQTIYGDLTPQAQPLDAECQAKRQYVPFFKSLVQLAQGLPVPGRHSTTRPLS